MSQATVIISSLNEQYLTKTLDSLLSTTPVDILPEVIVIDDVSDQPVVYNNPRVRVVRNSERQGLIRSRNIGSRLATSPVVISMDAHVHTFPGWLPPIIKRLEQRDRCVVIPMSCGLKPDTWITDGPTEAKTGWRWNLDFRWIHDDKSDFTPAVAGHCFAYTKRWWEEAGGFDDGMLIWGGENIEFPLRTWLAGGTVEVVRDSKVAHWFKSKWTGYSQNWSTLQRNKARIAEVWFDDKKDLFYQAANAKPGSIDFGDISAQLEIRKRLQVRGIDWFLKTMQPELGVIFAHKNAFPNSRVAILGAGPSLDYLTEDELQRHDVVLGVNYTALHFPCHFAVFHDIKPATAVRASHRLDITRLVMPQRLKGPGSRFVDSDVNTGCAVFELGPQDKDTALKTKDPPFFHHASTVHTAIHFAAFLGAKHITLYGCDVKYAPDGRSHTKLIPQYNKGFYWPKCESTQKFLDRIERGYDMIRIALAQWDIQMMRVSVA